ncbi:hypothetical protein N825_07305 [Skermanella stibiiresistens SB22]|uniref:Cellulose biosynthesis protein BcsN n=1 Tax=Skermanella stibiiresistens SB22 TaxID=1385369 RepID=W9H690_9PROT|nr:cellulose biosynthesis protein BcsN [Skermanella stibiiresistens]EWY39278.1 hypothetical protein N825_07305 [Skermanella stibiiresistens SB22]
MTPTLRTISRASAVAALLLTSACATTSSPVSSASGSSDIGRWVPIEPARAHVALAPANTANSGTGTDTLSGRELRTSQGELIQTLTLSNNTAIPGDNELVASFDYGPSSIFATDIHAPKVGRYAMAPSALSGLIGEMLPRANVQGEPQIRKNRYGLYGYVAAEYPGQAKCVLAWQVLDGDAIAQGFGDGGAPRRAGIQMRVCDARAQPAELIASFDSLRLDL